MKNIIAIIILTMAAAAACMPARSQTLLDKLPQEAPDFDSIEVEINDRTSPFYYPRLMEEFERNDTTMKLDKYRRLYYGVLLREDFDPYRPSAAHTADPALLTNYSLLTREECDTIIKYSQNALADNPFDLVQIYNLSRALKARGRTSLADIWTYKLRQLLMAILSSGTGTDMETAWHVIEPQHEYILLNALGLTAKKQIFIDPCFDYITVTDSDGRDVGGFYFNVSAPLEEYWRKHPTE